MERFIDIAVEQFARDHTEPETDLYVRLREETYRVMKNPEMQIDAIEGRFLKMLVRLTGARTVLELGMFTGYSALMWAAGLSENTLQRLVRADANSYKNCRNRGNGAFPTVPINPESACSRKRSEFGVGGW